MEKFGFVINHLGPNQTAHQLITSINEYLIKKDDCDFVIFYHNLTPLVVQPNFACTNLFDALNYNGRLIATDLNNASRILDYPKTKGRYFWPIDLEWTKGNAHYEQLSQIYRNIKLPIIARSQTYKDIFELSWGSNVIGVVEDFNAEKLVGVILDYENKNH